MASGRKELEKARDSPADTKFSEGGEEVLQALEERFPCSPWSRLW